MELTEHIALNLSERGYNAFSAALPPEPDRCVAVIATDLRPAGDAEGSRYQLLVRSSRDVDDALTDCAILTGELLDFIGALSPGGPLILRTKLEGGASFLGLDENRRARYSLNFRAWHC